MTAKSTKVKIKGQRARLWFTPASGSTPSRRGLGLRPGGQSLKLGERGDMGFNFTSNVQVSSFGCQGVEVLYLEPLDESLLPKFLFRFDRPFLRPAAGLNTDT